MDHLTVEGNLTCFGLHVLKTPDSRSKPDILLTSAHIAGNLRINRGESRDAMIDGSLLMEDARVEGEVNLSGTRIGGDLDMSSCTVTGEVFGDDGSGERTCPNVAGRVLLMGANLKSVHIHLVREGGKSVVPQRVSMERALIDKLVITGRVPDEAPAVGPSKAPEARVHAASLTIPQGIHDGNAPSSTNVSTSAMPATDVVQAADVASPDGSLPLFQCAGMEFRHLNLSGLSCDGWTPPSGGTEALLERRFLALTEFDRGTYVAVENWLRGRGEDSKANEVYLDRRREEMQPGRMSAYRRGLHSMLYRLVGYGVRTSRAAWLLVALGLIAFLFFLNPASMKPSPSLGENYGPVSARFDNHPPEWGAGDAAWMALRTVIPMVPMVARDEWEPSGKAVVTPFWARGRLAGWLESRPWKVHYDGLSTVISLCAWVLLPLILASATGLLKRQE